MIKKNLLITTKTLITTMLITLGLMLADNISNIKFTDNIITIYAMEHQNSTNSEGHTLILDDNIWHCYGSDNLIDYTYDGLLLNEYGWWKISNGTVDFSFNELALNEYGWWKITDGAVAINSKSNSLSRRSWITSMCNNPKKPHLNPKPKACDVSGSNTKDESLNWIFSKASRKSSNLLASIG